MSYGSVTVASNTSIQVVAANSQRHSLLITNLGASVIFLGDDSSVTTATGFALTSGSSLTEDSGGTKLYMGAYYARATTLATVRYWERVR